MGPIATTSRGQLEGAEVDGILRFAGIPFAKPPVDELRFRPPQPCDPWEGVRPATHFGDTSLQSPSIIEAMFGMEPEPASEDCLYLNVYTPALDDAARPVMVWIHGGAFIMGSGSGPLYDGVQFAGRGDVVFVSLNYRLAELGFCHLDHLDGSYAGSGNCGMADQVAALEWVRDNIAAFGGDPGNVTIFGESAGGMSVATLLAAPAARGLFHKAIPQSGAAHNIVSAKHAQEVTDDFLIRAGVTSVAELVDLPAERLLEVRAEVVLAVMGDMTQVITADGTPISMPWQPVNDGAFITERGIDAVMAGSAAGVPLLVGTTRDEWKLFGLMDQSPLDEQGLIERTSAVVGDGRRFVEAYEAAQPGLDPKALFGEMANDYIFRIPAIRLAEAQLRHTPGVYMYLFDWKSRAFGGILGACHAIELPFVFHRVSDPRMAMFLGEGAPVSLADQVQDAWIAFARTGDPNHAGLPTWSAYDHDRRATMRFAEQCEVVDDPMSVERRLWDTIL